MILKENTGQEIAQPGDVAKILFAILEAEDEVSREREHYWVVGLDGNKSIKYIELCALGSLTSSLIHPRETFRLAITKGVDTIIIAHNHPSGAVKPSKDDCAVTERLQAVGDLIGIKVIDHVIIGNRILNGKFYSFSSQGKI